MLDYKKEYLEHASYRNSLMLSLAEDAGYKVDPGIDPVDWPGEPVNGAAAEDAYVSLTKEKMNAALWALYVEWLSDETDDLVVALRKSAPDLVSLITNYSPDELGDMQLPFFDLFDSLYSKKVDESFLVSIKDIGEKETTGEVDMTEPVDKIIENLRRGEDVMKSINSNVKALRKGSRIKLVAVYRGNY